STGRLAETGYLKDLGATEVVARADLTGPARPLARERWAGGIDTVGSTTLPHVLSLNRYGGAGPARRPAGGRVFPTPGAPIILRGVSLLGIESTMAPLQIRNNAWTRLATDLDRHKLAKMIEEIDLTGVIPAGKKIVEGGIRGRLVVKIQ